jgi:hypothetical protein
MTAQIISTALAILGWIATGALFLAFALFLKRFRPIAPSDWVIGDVPRIPDGMER